MNRGRVGRDDLRVGKVCRLCSDDEASGVVVQCTSRPGRGCRIQFLADCDPELVGLVLWALSYEEYEELSEEESAIYLMSKEVPRCE